MADNDVGAALTGMLADFITKRDAMKFNAASPEGTDLPVPNVGVEGFGVGRPGLRGDVELSSGVTVGGSYRKQFDEAPPNWSARVGYHRRF